MLNVVTSDPSLIRSTCHLLTRSGRQSVLSNCGFQKWSSLGLSAGTRQLLDSSSIKDCSKCSDCSSLLLPFIILTTPTSSSSSSSLHQLFLLKRTRLSTVSAQLPFIQQLQLPLPQSTHSHLCLTLHVPLSDRKTPALSVLTLIGLINKHSSTLSSEHCCQPRAMAHPIMELKGRSSFRYNASRKVSVQ